MAKFSYDKSDKFSDKVTLLSGSASLTFSYNANCDANYYGTCDKMCVPSAGSEGHYTCNSSTGERVCLDGWSGVKCDTADNTDSSKDSSSTDERETDDNADANVDPDASKQESNSKARLSINMDTLWKVLAICAGVVIGTVIVVLWIWYKTKYRKKRSSMPKIVVSNEQFFEKTGNFIVEQLEPSAPGEETLARQQRGSVSTCHKDNALTSFSISDVNNNSTPPPVEQPEHEEI